MGRAKGKKLAKAERYLTDKKGRRCDGFMIYAIEGSELFGHLALVRFISSTKCMAQFNGRGPTWAQFPATDFMRRETFQKHYPDAPLRGLTAGDK